MTTVLDVSVCAHSSGGVGRWIRGLSRGLLNNSNNHISIDLPETHPHQPCSVTEAVSVPHPYWMAIPFIRRRLIRKGMLEATRADRIEKITGIPDVIHLSGVQPFGRGKVKIVTFFDDTPWTEPKRHTKETLFYASRLADLINDGAGVLAISRWSSSRAAELFNIPESRIGYAGGAAEDIFSPGEPDKDLLSEIGLEPGGYLLHVGSFVPRKNIPFLIRCFQQSEKKGRKLVLAGAEKWGSREATLGNIDTDVVVLESISDNLLLTLYRGAEALLVPSTSEGLGLPVLEALACGIPVISSDGGALPETVSSAGLILPVNDESAWTEAISTGSTESMKKSASEAERVTWNHVGARALEFYRSLM